MIAAAATGSIMGDNAGYWIGRRHAYALLVRYGTRIGMSATRIRLGQYLFRQHGGKVVFFGRFVALLRILAAFLAGVNRMPWRAFLVANAAGAVLWAATFGIGGYFFGKLLFQLHAGIGAVAFAIGLGVFLGCGYLIRRYEDSLMDAVEAAHPEPADTIAQKRPAVHGELGHHVLGCVPPNTLGAIDLHHGREPTDT